MAGTSWLSAETCNETMDEIIADLPLGIERDIWWRTNRRWSSSAIGEFMTSLWQAIAIIMAVSVISLGVRAGAIVALSIPLTLAIVFPVMEFVEHRSAADFARRPDHRPGVAR